MKIRIGVNEDIKRLCEVSKKCLKEAFTEENFKSSFNNLLEETLVCEWEGNIAGYCDFTCVAGEGELLQIAVDPEFRGRGIGKALFAAMVDSIKRQKVNALFLEVRTGNVTARNLYQSFGMKEVGLRRGFYNDPKEDALIYRLDL